MRWRAAKTKVFISHSRADQNSVGRLGTQLRRSGYSVFIDQKDIAGAEVWRLRLDAMIVNCNAVVFVLSTDTSRTTRRSARRRSTPRGHPGRKGTSERPGVFVF